jgi:hypothetical protein
VGASRTSNHTRTSLRASISSGPSYGIINNLAPLHQLPKAQLKQAQALGPKLAGEDRRAHPRAEVAIAILCERVGGPPLEGVTSDLGIGGTFIETTELLPFGTRVVIVGRLPGTTTDLRLPGIVRWQKTNGIGVQFDVLGPRETHAILTIVGTAVLPGSSRRVA